MRKVLLFPVIFSATILAVVLVLHFFYENQKPQSKPGRKYWEAPNYDRCYTTYESKCGLRLIDCDSGKEYSCMTSVTSGVEK